MGETTYYQAACSGMDRCFDEMNCEGRQQSLHSRFMHVL